MRVQRVILLAVFLFAWAATASAAGWLIYHDGPYKGKVVDAETNEPIAGAAVVGIWYLEKYGGASAPQEVFFDAKEAVTGKDGEFIIPSVTGIRLWPLAKLGRPTFKIYKPGYDSYPSYDLMKPGITGMEQKGFLEHEGNTVMLTKTKTKIERMKARISIDICRPDEKDSAALALCIPREKIPVIVDILEKEAHELGLLP